MSFGKMKPHKLLFLCFMLKKQNSSDPITISIYNISPYPVLLSRAGYPNP